MNPYIADILAQPEALRAAVNSFSPVKLLPICDQLQSGSFDRLILSGMGSSFYAAYPAYLRLSHLPLPVLLLNGAELLHSLQPAIGERSLLWLNSQSGKSAELVNLTAAIKSQPPAAMLACVNDLTSPLAQAAQVCLPIHAGEEATVSTKTYINMLAVNLLVTEYLMSGNIEALKSELLAAADAMQLYLARWQTLIPELDDLVGDFETLMILGRGTSLSAVWNGSLINKEAAKCAFEGMQAADFRHGPLELAAPGFTALIFAGAPKTRALNRALALEIMEYGGRALWVDQTLDAGFATILISETSEHVRPLVEILPLQMLTLVMAQRKGIQVGHFRHVGKVTDRE
jgi:glucosamine--fructose-6-phosphate aminotransferase (isomerizing)